MVTGGQGGKHAAAASAPPPDAPAAKVEERKVLPTPSQAELLLVEERKKHEQELKTAVADAKARAEAETDAEKKRLQELEARLGERMAKLEKERFELKIENEELHRAQDRRPVQPAQPQVIFEEMKLTEELRERIEGIVADRTAAKVVEIIKGTEGVGVDATRSFRSGAMMDSAKEEALKEGTSLKRAQQRVVELLEELDARTRLEGVRLREAVNQTRIAAGEQLMVAAAQQLAAQERELQEAMDGQVGQIRIAAVTAIQERDELYDSRARKEWPILNERAQRFADNTLRMQQLRVRAVSPSGPPLELRLMLCPIVIA